MFGPGKVGEFGGQLGRGVREFHANMDGGAREATGSHSCTGCAKAAGADATFRPSCGAKPT